MIHWNLFKFVDEVGASVRTHENLALQNPDIKIMSNESR